MSYLDHFPKLTSVEYKRILRNPSGRIRCVIDTDARADIDDQFALAWALMSQNKLQIEGVYAAPYSFRHRLNELRQAYHIRASGETVNHEELTLVKRYAAQLNRLGENGVNIEDDDQLDPQQITMVTPATGMEKSHAEILMIYEKLGIEHADKVFRGSDRYLNAYEAPIQSDAVEHLITLARDAAPGSPLYVVTIGAPTNIASAILLAPEIISNIVVIWIAGYPTNVINVFQESFNMEQDMLASQLLFDSGVPLVYLPGLHIGAQLTLSLPEVETWVKGQGAIGDFLYERYTDNPHHAFQGIGDAFGRTWNMASLMSIAWLLQPDWVPTYLTDAPYLTTGQKWYRRETPRHTMREALDINRDAILRDYFTKLTDHTST